MNAKQTEKQEAIARLREWVKPGDTIYTVLRNTSRSGMSREIGIVLISKNGSMLHPNYMVAKALGYRVGKRDGVIVGGCGMDMGFHIVYNLGRVLFQDEFICTGATCRSNDYSNGDRNREPHKHSDAGYSLNHSWI